MRKFNINVDGKAFVVEVEEVGGAATAAPVASYTAAPVSTPVIAAKAVGAGAPFPSPMPGVILDVVVADGATVKKGDTVVVLEAMKMENAIAAPKDGVVSVAVVKGATVGAGDVLFTIA